MLSYHKWKMLNEQFVGAPLTLGIKLPNNIGVVGAVAPTEEEIAADTLAEAKKKKKMLRDPQLDEPDPELGDELGDEADIEDIEDDDDECKCPRHDDDDEGIDIDGDGDPDIDPDKVMMCKKCKKCKKSSKKSAKKSKKSAKKSSKKMTKEEEDWWASVHDMSMGNIDTKNWDGMTEDSLLSPEDPNAGLTDEPGPGEVGYAPQGVVGGLR